LNSFRHIHNAAVLPAFNRSPGVHALLYEIAHMGSEIVRRAVYHGAVYQVGGQGRGGHPGVGATYRSGNDWVLDLVAQLRRHCATRRRQHRSLLPTDAHEHQIAEAVRS
jgi:hypothetical protein